MTLIISTLLTVLRHLYTQHGFSTRGVLPYSLCVLFLACPGMLPASVLTLTNSGFDNADLSGWMATGSVSVVGSVLAESGDGRMFDIDPYHGWMAQLVTGYVSSGELDVFFGLQPGTLATTVQDSQSGSGIRQDFWGVIGQRITLMWNFMAGDYFPYTDTAFFTLRTPAGEALVQPLAAVGNGAPVIAHDAGPLGWQSLEYTLPTTGTYSLGFGVVDGLDNSMPSRLFVDSGAIQDPLEEGHTPEPGTWLLLLLGLGLIGLPLTVRRRKTRRTGGLELRPCL